jgi:hypothetical protein
VSDYLPPVVARLTMDLGSFLTDIAKAKAAMKGLAGDFKIGVDSQPLAMMLQQLRGINVATRETADGLGVLAAKSAAAGAAGRAAGTMFVGGFRLTATALHWVIAGGAELLAVVLPAIVALAAGLAVMAPAAQSVVAHMQALNTATQATGQMFGQSIGDVLGLGHALQTAQDAARPAVYGALGSALIAVKGHMGELTTAGTQVSQMFQAFAAKLAVEFGPGGSLGSQTSSLFAHMTTDLQGLAQVLGNVGHTIINIASAMPGIAQFLLSGLVGISGFLSRISGAAPILTTVGFAFEELYRYGGAAARILALVGTGLAKVMEVAGVAATAIGLLIYKLATAKNAAQQFGDSLQAAVMKMSNSNAFSGIINNIATLNQKMADAPRVLNGTAESMMRFGNAAQTANPEIASFGTAIKQQMQDMANVAAGAAYLARTYGTTFVGALALADQANVKLAGGITGSGQAAMVARMQVQSLVQGYQAMGQSSGEVGADMTALAIQSGLASSQVGKLNSAWDDFTKNLTGGTSALAQLTLGLTSLSTGANNVTNVLGKTKSITLSIQQFAGALKNMGTSGAQAWQNFNQAISNGQGMLDWLRTAGAEGAISAQKFKQAGLDMASAFVPLAAQSKTAQSELLGLVQQIDPSIQTFGQLKSAIANSGASFGGLSGIVGSATQKMANMNSVAQTLGNVLSTALVAALQAAQVSASGAGTAMQKYAQDLMNGNQAAASADYSNVISDLEKLGLNAQQAAALIAQVTQNLNNMPTSKTITITTNLVTNSISTGGQIPVGVKAPGHAKGTPAAAPGWAWVGEAGPELVKMRGGETVLPHEVSMGYAGGAGGIGDQHIHIYLDGRELHAAVAKQSMQAQRRTGHSGMSRRTR